MLILPRDRTDQNMNKYLIMYLYIQYYIVYENMFIVYENYSAEIL